MAAGPRYQHTHLSSKLETKLQDSHVLLIQRCLFSVKFSFLQNQMKYLFFTDIFTSHTQKNILFTVHCSKRCSKLCPLAYGCQNISLVNYCNVYITCMQKFLYILLDNVAKLNIFKFYFCKIRVKSGVSFISFVIFLNFRQLCSM